MNKETAGQKEVVRQFFRVEDMFDFDNLGFTNTVGKYKVGDRNEQLFLNF